MKYKIGEQVFDTYKEMVASQPSLSGFKQFKPRVIGLGSQLIDSPKPLKEYPENATEEEKLAIDQENQTIQESNIAYKYKEYETLESFNKRLYGKV